MLTVVAMQTPAALGDGAQLNSLRIGNGGVERQPAKQRRNIFGIRAGLIGTPLVGDRPDFTESTEAVPFGRVQIEMGYTFTYDGGGDSLREHTAPELLVRIGLVEDIEFRLGWVGYIHARQPGDKRDGASDIEIGAKFKLVDQRDVAPHFALLISTSAPTGSSDITTNQYNPKVGLLWAYDLSPRLSLAGNVNFAWPSADNGGRYFQQSASVSLAAGLTESLGAYVEYFGFFGLDGGGSPSHSFNTGVTCHITNNFQIDARVGLGLNQAADDLFAGIGMTVRF